MDLELDRLTRLNYDATCWIMRCTLGVAETNNCEHNTNNGEEFDEEWILSRFMRKQNSWLEWKDCEDCYGLCFP